MTPKRNQTCQEDTYWLLAAAMLSSLVEDLHRLRKKGLWQTHPDEMRLHPWYRTPADLAREPSKTGKAPKLQTFLETPQEVLFEFHSVQTEWLFSLIAAETQNSIKISKSDLLRWAKACKK